MGLETECVVSFSEGPQHGETVSSDTLDIRREALKVPFICKLNSVKNNL